MKNLRARVARLFTINRNRGLGLVEAMISIAIVGIGIIGILNVVGVSNQTQKHLDQKLATLSLTSDITTLLTIKASCLQTMNGTPAFAYDPVLSPTALTGIAAIKNDIGNRIYSTYTDAANPGKTYVNGMIKITSITVYDYAPLETPGSSTDIKFYSGTAKMKIEFSKAITTLGPQNFIKEISLSVKLTNGGVDDKKISECYSTSLGGGGSQWINTALDDGIYYNKKVGIGTTTPSDSLDIVGNTKVSGHFLSTSSTSAFGFGIPTSNAVYGGYDGTAAIGAYANFFGKDAPGFGATPGGGAEIVIDSRTAPTSFNILSRDAGWNLLLRLTSTGYVGIGTGSPLARFSVVKDDAIYPSPGDHYGDDIAIYTYSNSTSPGYLTYRARGTAGWPTMVLAGDVLGSFYISGYTGSGGWTNGANIYARAENNWSSSGVANSYFTFETLGNGALSEKMRITSTGNVGFGITNPTYKIDVNGDVNMAFGSSALRFGGVSVCTSAGCTIASDRKLKENIQPLNDSLKKILTLQGVEYDYKSKERFTDKHQIGLIAQDVELAYPEVVTTDAHSGLKSISYGQLTAPLIEATKSLYGRIVALELSEAKLKAQNKYLVEQVQDMHTLMCKHHPMDSICRR